MIKVLVVDDSALMRRLLGSVFRGDSDFDVAYARNGEEALAQLHSFLPDVITLDVNMPVMDGIACLNRIMLERPTPTIMVSSQTEEGAAITLEAMELGAVDFMTKPEGAMSLNMREFGPGLVAKVVTASTARLRRSHRLAERVRLKTGTIKDVRTDDVEPVAEDDAVANDVGTGLVIVGTSTGGPPALDKLLSRLPAAFPWPVLIAQHMPAAFTGPLARRLNGLAPLAVTELIRPTKMVPGNVYVAKGDADVVVTLRDGVPAAAPVPSSPSYLWHPSVERLVKSAMEHFVPSRLIGVLLTGMGNDGVGAMTTLRTLGGRTIAEAEETAVVWGMPGELFKSGGAEAVLPIEGIADKLISWAK